MSDKNAVATQTPQTPMELAIDNKFIDGLSEQLTKKEQYGLQFPQNYSVSNALNSAYLILQETTDSKQQLVLQSCSRQSVASALIDMTVQGLNPVKKQCYFVGFGGKLKLMRSYQGTKAVAKRCGVKKVNSQVIYDGDIFKYHIQNGVIQIDEHTQDFMNIDIAKIKGAYAILELEDGSTYTEIMNINQLKKAWAKGYGYKDGQGVHGDFTDQMAKKTVESRACKGFINSSDDENLVEAFNQTTDNEDIDVPAVEVQHEVDTQANSEEFEIPVEVEKVKGEVVEEPKKEEVKEKAKTSKQQKPTDEQQPDWMK